MQLCPHCQLLIDLNIGRCHHCQRRLRPRGQLIFEGALVLALIAAIWTCIAAPAPLVPPGRPSDPYRKAQTAINVLYSGRCGNVITLRADPNGADADIATCKNGLRFLVSYDHGEVRVSPL